jgi:hypothetical protein
LLVVECVKKERQIMGELQEERNRDWACPTPGVPVTNRIGRIVLCPLLVLSDKDKAALLWLC